MSKLPPAQPSRIENGPPGGFGIPPDAYWDAHTWRSLQMFSITGCPIGCWPEFVRALAHVKKAAALANERVGALDSRRCDAIVRACDEVAAGELDAEFVVDVIHGGDGSCSNMNANEVIANRALELLGHPKRCYGTLHPIQRGRPAAAERLRADHGLVLVQEHPASDQGLPDARRQLRRRNSSQHRAARAPRRRIGVQHRRPEHRAWLQDRLAVRQADPGRRWPPCRTKRQRPGRAAAAIGAVIRKVRPHPVPA
jgi:hypothetical protein